MTTTPFLIVQQMKKMLRNLDHCLNKAKEDALARKYDVDVLVQARLAPTMLPLAFQIRTACDTAKLAVARITGKEAPSHADDEKTIAELSERIHKVLAFLDGFAEADFSEVATRDVTTPRWEGKSMTATNYFLEHALPNFFFHVTTAYALLRHNGVDVGKRDFLGALSFK